MTFSFTLVDTAGASHVLDDSLGIRVNLGAHGLAFPVISVNTDKYPYAPGGRLRRVSTAVGQLELPLRLKAASTSALDTLVDSLRSWIFPGTERRSEPYTIQLQITRADGAQRRITGVGVLDPGDDGRGFPTWQHCTLTIYCQEAFWEDTTATTHTFTSGTGLTAWFPYFPMDFMPSATLTLETMAIGGDLECWPIWTITGPGTNPKLSNLTTGETLDLSSNGGLTLLSSSKIITIDTSEGVKSIVNELGTNLWPYATPSSEIWPFEKGNNQIRVEMSGTTGASSIALSYRRRWSGAHR